MQHPKPKGGDIVVFDRDMQRGVVVLEHGWQDMVQHPQGQGGDKEQRGPTE